MAIHTVVKLTAGKQDLKSAYKFNTNVAFTIENTNQSCEIPGDDVMLGILHRLIHSQEETADGSC